MSAAIRRKHAPRRVGRPATPSGLPAPIDGQPFSLLGALRRTTGPLTPRDVAALIRKSERYVYKLIKTGKLPVPDFGFEATVVDPKAWADMIEHSNPHLVRSARNVSVA